MSETTNSTALWAWS